MKSIFRIIYNLIIELLDRIVKIANIQVKRTIYGTVTEKTNNIENDESGITNTHNEIGLTYHLMGRYAKAVDHFHKELELSEELDDKALTQLLYNNLGVIYQNESKYDIALDYYDKEIRKEFIDIIHKGVHSTYKLLENLLHWSHPQRGTMNFKPQNIYFKEIINESVELVRNSATKKEIILSVDVPKNLIVHAEKDMLSIVTRNLLSNAIKYTPCTGQISVKAKTIRNNNSLATTLKAITMYFYLLL
jgi:signal transduction histidine kinase